ncbi:MAG: beta-ketoacyl-[acyl-carrier-protein] synthase family protein [Rhodobacteraceae bacterium]|nr:beta-ketoacyl-[acyl-carrier-protein] synthase family protein [Paracoccaceae bacterium]
MGAVSSLGMSAPETMRAMAAGKDGISALEFQDVERLQIRIGGQIKGYDETEVFSRPELALYDRFTQFAVLAAREAVAQSGLDVSADPDRAGVVLGTSGGGLQTQNENFRKVYQEGKNRVHPFVVPRLMNNAATSHLSMIHGMTGPSYTVSTACASSNHAMGQAFQMIRSGLSDVMLTGGSEAMLCFGGIKAWEGLRVMSKTGCRPFSRDRDGMVQGEGAAVFVFETLERARARGAGILAEIAGFSMTSDASDIVMPNREGAERAIRGALKDAGMGPGEVGYINAHGTGTTANDRSECRALQAVFGTEIGHLPVSSTKSMHGHLIGATGAVELLACIMALREGVIAPTINYTGPDPECDLDIVANIARRGKVGATLSNAFAFGGLNAVIALRAAP